jgi:hypothetical protein
MNLPLPPVEVPIYDKPNMMAQVWRYFFNSLYDMASAVFLKAKAKDPATPARGQAVIWLADGTGTGDDGDIMVMITDTSGTTKTATLVDFSAM